MLYVVVCVKILCYNRVEVNIMKLCYDKRLKDPTYYIQQGIRNGKKTTTKNVYTIGKHSELLKITDDPLAYANQKVKEYNEQYQAEKVKLSVTIDFNKKLTSTSDIVAKSKVYNIGYFYLQHLYKKLKIKECIDEMVENSKITFDCNTINRFLTFSRILDPRSKLGIYDHLDMYFEQPEYEYYHSLRFMSLLADNFDDYIAHLFKYSNDVVKRDTSVCYFDCSNVYFEIESADTDYVDPVTGEIISGLRKYGVSKEHRPNPIVQIGLFMDGQGIPITMCVNPGNQNEQLCAPDTERKMIRMFKDKSLIYCADAGLGSYDIRRFNSFGSRYFIVAQSIKKLSETLQQAVFNDIDYKRLSNDIPMTIDEMKKFDRNDPEKRDLYDDVIYKVIPADKAVDLGFDEEYFTSTGKEKTKKAKGNIKQYVIVTFSRKQMEYQRYIRNEQIKRAQKIIDSDRVEDLKKNQNDPKRFIKKKKNGEKDTYYLDQEKIDKEEMYDGFYAIATNLDAYHDVKEIFAKNSQRYKIEDCFRVMKTNFQVQPVYHRNRDRIVAHFMTCYTALLIYRLLEVKLNNAGYHYTINEIIENLKNMNVINNHDQYYQAVYSSSELCDAINDVFKLELNKEYYQPKDLRKKLRKIL